MRAAIVIDTRSPLPLHRQIYDAWRKGILSGRFRKGDRVVVKTTSGEVMAKLLEKQTAKVISLSSLNPEHPGRELSMSDVEWVARIVWASQ